MRQCPPIFVAGVALVLFLSGCKPATEPAPPVTASASPTPTRTKAPTVEPAFVDVAQTAGLRYRWTFAGKRPGTILQTIGHGCAFLDYDNDGNLDILLVGPTPALFRGDGKGHFTDVSAQTGLSKLSGNLLGCAVGDYDNDGFDDIYLSAYRGGVLLHNERGKRFADSTRTAGLAPQPWGTSCTFADFDGDGRLDFFVGNYVRFGPDTVPQLCNAHSFMTSCGPGDYEAEWGICYRNRGDGHFVEMTDRWAMKGTQKNASHGKTLGVAVAPIAPGKRPALALANDQTPGDLFLFGTQPPTNQGIASGMAYGADQRVYGGMGIDWGDYDNDGQLDLVIATYRNQPKWVFHNDGGTFTPQDMTTLGMDSSRPYVAFGVKWVDFDNDGWLDQIYANGHVQDNVADMEIMDITSPGARYAQPTVLYHNRGGKRFEDASARLQQGAEVPIVGRGLATGDYDNDGCVDVLLVNNEGAPLLLHNVTPHAGHWLSLTLKGRRCNRDAYGALLTIEADGKKWTRFCHADGSYLSSSDKRVHVGIGDAKTATITVHWPDGRVSRRTGVPANHPLTLAEP